MDIRNDIKYYMAREAVTFKQLASLMSEKNGKKSYNFSEKPPAGGGSSRRTGCALSRWKLACYGH